MRGTMMANDERLIELREALLAELDDAQGLSRHAMGDLFAAGRVAALERAVRLLEGVMGQVEGGVGGGTVSEDPRTATR